MGVGLVVDPVPHHLVVHARGYASAHREYQFPVKGFLQEVEDLPAFGSVRQVGGSAGPREVNPVPLPRVHVVGDDDGTRMKPIALSFLVDIVAHLAVGLVPHHIPKNGRADGTFGPLFVAYELHHADLVVLVGTSQHKNIVIVLSRQLLLWLFDLEFLQADHTLFLLHLALAQLELQSGVVTYLEHIVIFFLLELVLLVDKVDHERHHLVILVVLLDRVLVVQLHLHLLLLVHFHPKFLFLPAALATPSVLLCLHFFVLILFEIGRAHIILDVDMSQQIKGLGGTGCWWRRGTKK